MAVEIGVAAACFGHALRSPGLAPGAGLKAPKRAGCPKRSRTRPSVGAFPIALWCLSPFPVRDRRDETGFRRCSVTSGIGSLRAIAVLDAHTSARDCSLRQGRVLSLNDLASRPAGGRSDPQNIESSPAPRPLLSCPVKK